MPGVVVDEGRLRERLRGISRDHQRWGYRAHAELLLEGFCLNRTRTQRIWREEGLRVSKKAESAAG